jgi:hypothetical protein
MESLQLMIFMTLFIAICVLLVWDGLDNGFNRILRWALVVMQVGVVIALAGLLAAFMTDLLLLVIG